MIDESKHPTEDKKEPTDTSSWRSLNGIAAALLLIAVVGGLGYFVISNIESVAVQAACEGIAGGYSCSFTGDNKNATTLNVCWSISRVCENGVKSSAHKCQSIYFQPGKGSKRIIANSEFENNEKCNKVSATAIEDVSIGIPYAPQQAASKQ